MQNRFYCIFLLFIIPCIANGQSRQQSLNEKAARYFSKKSWERLIDLGEKALADGKTFEDLHYRMGVAYYQVDNYWKSIPHLEKAGAQHKDETQFQKYLTYSYRSANRKADAMFAARNFPDSLKKELGLVIEKPIESIRLDAGLKKSSVLDSVGNMFFGRVSTEHQVNYQFKIAQAITFKKQSYLRTDFNQFQYYLRGEYTIAKGFAIVPAFHYLRFTAERPIPDGLGGFIGGFYTDFIQNGFAGMLGVRKHFGRMEIMPFLIFSNLKTNASNYPISIINSDASVEIVLDDNTFSAEHFQVGFSANYVLPFWNNAMQLGGVVHYHRNSLEENVLWKINSKWQVHPKAMLELEYFKGGVLNFLENKAELYNNSYSPIDNRISAQLSLQVFDDALLFLTYQQVKKPEVYFDFDYNVFLVGLEFEL